MFTHESDEEWFAISIFVLSERKDFSKLQTVTYIVKQCKTYVVTTHTTNSK